MMHLIVAGHCELKYVITNAIPTSSPDHLHKAYV